MLSFRFLQLRKNTFTWSGVEAFWSSSLPLEAPVQKVVAAMVSRLNEIVEKPSLRKLLALTWQKIPEQIDVPITKGKLTIKQKKIIYFY
jgi:hypothetical protein